MSNVEKIKQDLLRLVSDSGKEFAAHELLTLKLTSLLAEVLRSSNNLGGMGQYGEGWNDRGHQIEVIITNIIKELNGKVE
jgi:hypothetical protein